MFVNIIGRLNDKEIDEKVIESKDQLGVQLEMWLASQGFLGGKGRCASAF
ncbi:hypothetical protein MHB50_15500 [Siminovitchia sp. FSL H7-0308]